MAGMNVHGQPIAGEINYSKGNQKKKKKHNDLLEILVRRPLILHRRRRCPPGFLRYATTCLCRPCEVEVINNNFQFLVKGAQQQELEFINILWSASEMRFDHPQQQLQLHSTQLQLRGQQKHRAAFITSHEMLSKSPTQLLTNHQEVL